MRLPAGTGDLGVQMDSVCIKWIQSEKRYIITALTRSDGLVTKFAKHMHDVILVMQELEDKYAT